MKLRKLFMAITLGSGLFFSTLAHADRQITDQLGREVTIPDTVNRVVVLQHQTLNIINQLDGMQDVVGVLSSWEKDLGKSYLRLAPSLKNMPMPGDLTNVNIESLMALKPQVVFVANYAPESMIKQITAQGIPVIGISLRVEPKSQNNKMNPTLADPQYAYDEGLKQGIRLIANVINKQANGEALIKAIFANQGLIKARLADLKPEQRVRVYLANPDLHTYGSGKYTGVMMQRAGAVNVAAATLKGYKAVSMEQVLNWNPQVIFVQNRFPSVYTEINDSDSWKWLKAVKDHQVYLMPQYAKAWGYPMPEAIALGELWMAKTLYPQRFKDVDLAKKVQDYYHQFYRTNYIAAPNVK